MKARRKAGLIVAVFLILVLMLCAGVANSELKVKLGITSHRGSLFCGSWGPTVGVEYLFHSEESLFGIAGGWECAFSDTWKNTPYSIDGVWRDFAVTFSYFYFLTKRIRLGAGLEYHWTPDQAVYFHPWAGLGTHLICGFDLGKAISAELSYKNEGVVSLGIGYKF